MLHSAQMVSACQNVGMARRRSARHLRPLGQSRQLQSLLLNVLWESHSQYLSDRSLESQRLRFWGTKECSAELSVVSATLGPGATFKRIRRIYSRGPRCTNRLRCGAGISALRKCDDAGKLTRGDRLFLIRRPSFWTLPMPRL